MSAHHARRRHAPHQRQRLEQCRLEAEDHGKRERRGQGQRSRARHEHQREDREVGGYDQAEGGESHAQTSTSCPGAVRRPAAHQGIHDGLPGLRHAPRGEVQGTVDSAGVSWLESTIAQSRAKLGWNCGVHGMAAAQQSSPCAGTFTR